ncbi:hypothetical protein XU18_4619 [Perkinsela sp. CCAP 1560/4]|nr:hypothetical protein XU18_4619 [Perkinsela sp. CCAP 1560/4]|eukprot:KNH04051.1 hypothetical protein XU18_4619 [Perkinsela sp. CCAP 1560/4]
MAEIKKPSSSYTTRDHESFTSDYSSSRVQQQENDAILAALASDIDNLKKASLALKSEVNQDISLIAKLKHTLGESNNGINAVISRMEKLKQVSTYTPLVFLLTAICILLLILYVVSRL